MRLLIASSKGPEDEVKFHIICTQIRALAIHYHALVPDGILWTGGPGCTNLAFDLIGKDEDKMEQFANSLTMALMPAKWTTTSDPLPTEDTFALPLPTTL